MTNIPNITDIQNVTVTAVNLAPFSPKLEIISTIIGWSYFFAWSSSFYPQVFTNFRRKSVIGLNFDFLSLNMIGFILYGIYNIGMYAFPAIQMEYSQRFGELNQVELNDVFFPIHAAILTFITILQCFIYERGHQRVSFTARSILTIFLVIVAITAICAFFNIIHWLDFLYICGYLKLVATIFKYVPQAYMNYRRQSTVGWSIENILLDLTGSVLSTLQMILNAYNYHDWDSILGNPAKLYLSLFTFIADSVFILQHYVLYRIPTNKLKSSVC